MLVEIVNRFDVDHSTASYSMEEDTRGNIGDSVPLPRRLTTRARNAFRRRSNMTSHVAKGVSIPEELGRRLRLAVA